MKQEEILQEIDQEYNELLRQHKKKRKHISIIQIVCCIVLLFFMIDLPIGYNNNYSNHNNYNIANNKAPDVSYEDILLKNEIPFYTSVNQYDNLISLYAIDNKVYGEYFLGYDNLKVFAFQKITEDISLEAHRIYKIDNNNDEIFLYTDRNNRTGVVSLNDNLYYIPDYLYFEDVDGSVIYLNDIATRIFTGLSDLILLKTVDDSELVNPSIEDDVFFHLEIPENQPFGVLKLNTSEQNIKIIEFNSISTNSRSKTGHRYLSRALNLQGVDIYNEVVDGEEVTYLKTDFHLNNVFDKTSDKTSDDMFNFYIEVFSGGKYVRCSNVIEITREQYNSSTW